MKISGLSTAFNLLNSVRERKEGEGGTGQNAYENLFQKKKDDSQRQDTPSEAEVQAAAAEFLTSVEAQAGLTAAIEGSGPGLRVVLRDSQGHQLRQMSGSEFIQMRENSRLDARKRGKILDQKF